MTVTGDAEVTDTLPSFSFFLSPSIEGYKQNESANQMRFI
jgi:hypothetical protein